jgi:hypothetical protein
MTVHAPQAAKDHLERLGEVLQRRGWRVALTTPEVGPLLTVTDPDAPKVSETIVCHQAHDDTWHFLWGPDRARVASVWRAHHVANRLHLELRGTPDPDWGRR